MGLLDDAIREHLELKRRRGADPDSVAREEREALGPPRRGEFAAPAEAAPEDVLEPSAEGVAPAEAPEVPPEEPLDQLEPPPAAPPALGGDPQPDEDPWHEEPDEVPASDALERGPAAEPRAAGEEDEDVLEETPDFLQETPEHDRLWLEQRPPRDFDFDR